jgi:hypothetical protein
MVIGICVHGGIGLGQIHDILVYPLELDEGNNRADGQRKQEPAKHHFFYQSTMDISVHGGKKSRAIVRDMILKLPTNKLEKICRRAAFSSANSFEKGLLIR